MGHSNNRTRNLNVFRCSYQRDNSDSTEYLTLTVAKDKTKQRPEFISIIIPNNVVQSNGIFIKFAKTVTKNGEMTMELEKGKPVKFNLRNVMMKLALQEFLMVMLVMTTVTRKMYSKNS
jgi:hypothetical protein